MTLARPSLASALDASAMWLEQLAMVDTGGVAKILGGGQPEQEPSINIVKLLHNSEFYAL
jgi:hypothetical protein